MKTRLGNWLLAVSVSLGMWMVIALSVSSALNYGSDSHNRSANTAGIEDHGKQHETAKGQLDG